MTSRERKRFYFLLNIDEASGTAWQETHLGICSIYFNSHLLDAGIPKNLLYLLAGSAKAIADSHRGRTVGFDEYHIFLKLHINHGCEWIIRV
jgi:hypothetical protein